MAKTYQGKPVTEKRAARAGDPDHNASKDQVIVTLADGSEKTVERSELRDA